MQKWQRKKKIELKACVCYFSLFLKEKCISLLFWMTYIEKKFNSSCFFFPLFHEHSLSLELPWASCLLKSSWFEKLTAWVIETMLMAYTFSQMKKSRREVNQTNQVPNQDKHCERSSNFCYALNPWEYMPLNIKSNDIFCKKHLLVETFSSNN